jgi:hypothetical protein
LRHRAADRLSVAVLVGADDPARAETAEAFAPYLADLGIRVRARVVPRLGHALPPGDTLVESTRWLAADLERRRDDAKSRPGLAAKPNGAATARDRAAGMLEAAEADLARPELLSRGAALLEGIVARYGRTDAADKARELLKQLRDDEARRKALAKQQSDEGRKLRAASARRLERTGDRRGALRAWEELVKTYPGTDAAKGAEVEVRRLTRVLAAMPYLGLQLEGATTIVRGVTSGGPADKAGLRRGDRVLSLAGTKVDSPEDLREALRKHKPGDKLDVEVRRGDRTQTLPLEVGRAPRP